MKRFAQTVMLKDDPEIIRQYEEYHANPWPEVIEGGRRIGILHAYIYRYGRQLFMFMETVDGFDLERDMPKYTEHPKAQEWDALMRTFQEPVLGAPEGSTWVQMKEIYAWEAS
jgi:L-rhamnose mutarotase